MRLVFMGSAPLACPALETLLHESEMDVVAVITQPDRPKGRRLCPTACITKMLARQHGLRVLAPADVNTPESVEAIRGLAPDMVVVVAYGQILKPEVLELAPLGFVNLHASLLPRYRGAAPIQWSIVRGESVSGVSTMFINERMDAGDVIGSVSVPIDADDTAGTLHDKLAENGARLLAGTVREVAAGTAVRTPQDESLATYAPRLSKADGRIDWTGPATQLYNRVRGFNPWPCCFCRLPGRGARLRVLGARVEEQSGRAAGEPGSVLSVDGNGPVVQTGDGVLRLVEVQPEGRRAMAGSAYLRGHSLAAGDVLV